MHFLNDKFFRVSVIAFLLFMALPFMFAVPQPQGDEREPLQFEDKNPVYKIIGRVAQFYGFKKPNTDKDFYLKEKQIEFLEKQKADNKPENKANNNETPFKKQENPAQNKTISKEEQTAHPSKNKANNQRKTSSDAQNQLPAYINFNGKEYQVLTNKENKKYIMTKKGPLPLKSLPKTTYKQNKTSLYAQKQIQGNSSDEKTVLPAAASANKTENKNLQQTFPGQKTYAPYTAKTSNGLLGRDYFSSSNKKAGTLFQNYNASVKDIKEFQQANKQKEQKKAGSSFFRIYRTQVFNPATGKKEVITAKEQIDHKYTHKAEDIKQLTLTNIKEYSEQKFEYKTNTSKKGEEVTFPTEESVAILSSTPDIPPHTIVDRIMDDESLMNKLNDKFSTASKKAKEMLPNKKEDFPILEFVYKKQGQYILRAPKDSFNVVAISRSLADRVSLPIDQKDIDFVNTNNRLYVVPEEVIYEKYKALNIPVIFYPELSPANLEKAYNTIPEAIETLNRNKKTTAQTEQDQNKQQIEELLSK